MGRLLWGQGLSAIVPSLRRGKRRGFTQGMFVNRGTQPLLNTGSVLHWDKGEAAFYKVRALVPDWSIFM